MVLKLNISNKGKSWKLEVETDVLAGKSVGETIDGKEIKPELAGYELRITGGSDIAGFPMKESAEGIGLRRVLLTKGWGMKDSTKGIRRRKTVRGKTIAEKIVQVNINVVKEGSKKLEEIFPEQNKPKEVAVSESKTESKQE